MPWISGDHAHIRSESVEAFWIETVYERHAIKALVHGHPVTLATAETTEDAESLIERVLVQVERSEGDRWQHLASPLPGTEPHELTPKERQLLTLTPKERQLLTLTFSDRIMEQTVAHLLGCSVGQLAEHAVVKALTKHGFIVHIVDGDTGFYMSTPKGREAMQ